MNQIVCGKFTADGNAVNLPLGFVPAYFEAINANAADTEIFKLEWYQQMGDSKELWHYMLDNDGGDDVATPVKKASAGYVAEWDGSVVGERKSFVADYTGGALEDMFTVAAGHGFVEGERVKVVAGDTLPTGLSANTIYYVKYVSPTVFQLSLTSGGTAVAMTSDGTAPNYVFSLDNMKIAQGGKGVTISGDFMSDSDVIHYIAIQASRDIDHGDINA